VTPAWWPGAAVGFSRLIAIGAVVLLVGMLPWLSGQSAEYTVLRARYADQEATPEALAAIRAELGLDRGPWSIFVDWLGAALHGDLGRSWISNRPVLPGTLDALGVSLSLMGFALLVALVTAVALSSPALVAGIRGRPRLGSGSVAATLTALPEFLLAAMLLVVGGVWLGWFPPYGWQGLENVVLPALALGLPTGGLIGRLVANAITASFLERWVGTWQMAGFGTARIAASVVRRAVPSVLDQVGLVLIGLTGGAVAVEEVFAIPGLGRVTLTAASAQDVPALQAGVLAMLSLAVVVGVAVALLRRILIGPALRHGSLPVPVPVNVRRRRDLVVPVVCGALLAVTVVTGLLRDPFVSAHARLAGPTAGLPLGADASGRDLLARVGHGAATTLGIALLVVLACLVVGLVLGSFPRASTGPREVANAVPSIIAGLVVAAILGPSAAGAALAVALVSWAPLAAHAGALVTEAHAQPHVRILPVLGAGRARILLRHVLPTVLVPVTRHAMLRLPGVALGLAALGFLGLGAAPPTPEWGLVLAEGTGYVERAPWVVLAPAVALVLVSVLAVSLSSLSGWSVRLWRVGSRRRR
jgi:peptide/nickel transport system permease protein